MRHSLFTTLIIAGLTVSACGQNIPQVVKTGFKKQFSTADHVKWSKENSHEFEAEFKMEGNKLSATFDEKGNWKETEQSISSDELPMEVKETLTAEFPDYVIKSPEKLSSPEYVVAYEMIVKKDGERLEVLFTPDGKLVKKKVEKGDEEEDAD
jgi:hypothetical protein